MRYILVLVCTCVVGCVSIPPDIEPVDDFEVTRYLGKWYEIARLDHSFERGLDRVTAEYIPRKDGGINVINRGYNLKDEQWEEAEGKAYFVGGEQVGHLKVSFFGPFYGSYIIFSLGDNYDYSLVTSVNKSYFWLLAREPVIDDALKIELINQAATLGFDTESLIYVDQSEQALVF
jgi:apolipoprotein D and lipocalin family protein